MNIAMIGGGYVGLVSAACFSEFGHKVTCVDVSPNVLAQLQRGEIPIYEPGLDTLVARNVAAGRLVFTGDLAQAVAQADATFIAVGTPSRRGDGHADLQYVFEAARSIAKHARDNSVIVTKSTVPVGTGEQIRSIVAETVPGKTLHIASNPEFLREGSAIEDFMRPDRVVAGADSDVARDVLRAIYRPLSLRDVPMLFTSLVTSELIKYSANAFLAVKISFINEIADFCEMVGADVQDVSKGIGMDKRIGDKFLHPGPGYGGSCFPKDTLALTRSAEEAGVTLRIVETTIASNDRRKRVMADRIIAACGGSVRGKKLAVLGLTFKPNTDDMRDSPSLVILPILKSEGADLHVFDPAGMERAKPLMPDLHYHDKVDDVFAGADAVILMTEWNEFRALDFTTLKSMLKAPLMIDLRNVYRPEDMAKLGIEYHSVGRKTISVQ
jgi:UDPglucose 6-dehydrogenase